MTTPSRKAAFIGIAALLLLTFHFLVSSTSPPPVRLAYLHTTNIESQVLGVFRIENVLDESITLWSGAFHPIELNRGNARHVADLGGPRRISPGLTNTLEIAVPTNGGSYRLVMSYRPDSQMRHQTPLVEKAFRLLPASVRNRLDEAPVAMSDYFQALSSR